MGDALDASDACGWSMVKYEERKEEKEERKDGDVMCVACGDVCVGKWVSG